MRYARNPLFWLCALLVVLSCIRNFSAEDYQKKTVASDARGYYAYLPAVFLHNDPTFTKTLEAERTSFGYDWQTYVFEDANGKRFNKYFPGIALVQLPFFGLACAVDGLSGHELTGYSHTFINFFYFGYLVFSLLGLLLFHKVTEALYPNLKGSNWLMVILYIATPILFYAVEIPLSHSYTFFYFGAFSWLILKLKEKFTLSRMILLGLIVGLITITRPTNVLVIFAIPFLLGSKAETLRFFSTCFGRPKWIFFALLGFLPIVFVLLFSWKWQSGQWFFWPYNGEGFNWMYPQIWSTLFSFRVGLFVHTPILLLLVPAFFGMWKKKRFAAGWWLLYCLLNTYVIASWWCWDYESLFGHRPFTEHLFFMVLPLFGLLQTGKKWVWIPFVLFACLGLTRYIESVSGFMTDQRFTATNYFESLQFWSQKNKERWVVTSSCTPFGTVIDSQTHRFQDELLVDEGTEFVHTIEFQLPEDHRDERLFIRMQYDKYVYDTPVGGVLFVMDAYNPETGKRGYFTEQLFNDRYEAHEQWKSLEISGYVQDNFSEYTVIRCYIWNHSRDRFKVRNVSMTLERYGEKS